MLRLLILLVLFVCPALSQQHTFDELWHVQNGHTMANGDLVGGGSGNSVEAVPTCPCPAWTVCYQPSSGGPLEPLDPSGWNQGNPIFDIPDDHMGQVHFMYQCTCGTPPTYETSQIWTLTIFML